VEVGTVVGKVLHLWPVQKGARQRSIHIQTVDSPILVIEEQPDCSLPTWAGWPVRSKRIIETRIVEQKLIIDVLSPERVSSFSILNMYGAVIASWSGGWIFHDPEYLMASYDASLGRIEIAVFARPPDLNEENLINKYDLTLYVELWYRDSVEPVREPLVVFFVDKGRGAYDGFAYRGIYGDVREVFKFNFHKVIWYKPGTAHRIQIGVGPNERNWVGPNFYVFSGLPEFTVIGSEATLPALPIQIFPDETGVGQLFPGYYQIAYSFVDAAGGESLPRSQVVELPQWARAIRIEIGVFPEEVTKVRLYIAPTGVTPTLQRELSAPETLTIAQLVDSTITPPQTSTIVLTANYFTWGPFDGYYAAVPSLTLAGDQLVNIDGYRDSWIGGSSPYFLGGTCDETMFPEPNPILPSLIPDMLMEVGQIRIRRSYPPAPVTFITITSDLR
jgi:hypothetical protein